MAASIAELCRREGLAESMYYKWSKEFMEAGKKRLSGGDLGDACGQHLGHRLCHNSRFGWQSWRCGLAQQADDI